MTIMKRHPMPAPLREPPATLPPVVRVYRNLTRQCLSLQAAGRVIGHAHVLLVEDARPVISEAGRQRVIATGRKTVHAYVEGVARVLTLEEAWAIYDRHRETAQPITYNPTRAPGFAYRNRPGVQWNGGGAVLLFCTPDSGAHTWLLSPKL